MCLLRCNTLKHLARNRSRCSSCVIHTPTIYACVIHSFNGADIDDGGGQHTHNVLLVLRWIYMYICMGLLIWGGARLTSGSYGYNPWTQATEMSKHLWGSDVSKTKVYVFWFETKQGLCSIRLLADMVDVVDLKLHFLGHWGSILVPGGLDFCVRDDHISDPWVRRDSKGGTLGSKAGFWLMLEGFGEYSLALCLYPLTYHKVLHCRLCRLLPKPGCFLDRFSADVLDTLNFIPSMIP